MYTMRGEVSGRSAGGSCPCRLIEETWNTRQQHQYATRSCSSTLDVRSLNHTASQGWRSRLVDQILAREFHTAFVDYCNNLKQSHIHIQAILSSRKACKNGSSRTMPFVCTDTPLPPRTDRAAARWPAGLVSRMSGPAATSFTRPLPVWQERLYRSLNLGQEGVFVRGLSLLQVGVAAVCE